MPNNIRFGCTSTKYVGDAISNNVEYGKTFYSDSKELKLGDVVGLDDLKTRSSEWAVNNFPHDIRFSGSDSVCYGGGKYAIFSVNGRITNAFYFFYSLDCVSWVRVDIPGVALNSMTYGNGKFVVTGDYGEAFYSTDCITWTEVDTHMRDRRYSVVYLGGKFLANGGGFVGIDGNYELAYSLDGITWQSTTTPYLSELMQETGAQSATWKSIAYGNGRFIATITIRPGYNPVGNYPILVYSDDGISWDYVDMSEFEGFFHSPIYGNGRFLLKCGSDVLHSSDGITWVRDLCPSNNLYAAFYRNGRFFAWRGYPDYSDPGLYESFNGLDWAEIDFIESGYHHWKVVYCNDRFIMIGSDVEFSPVVAYKRYWYERVSMDIKYVEDLRMEEIAAPVLYWDSIAYGNGKFVAVSSSPHMLYTSGDGKNWEQARQVDADGAGSLKVIFGNGKFVVVSSISNSVICSSNGIDWLSGVCGMVNPCAIAYGNGRFVVIDDNNNAAYSYDGVNWIAASLPSPYQWADVTYGNSKFVAVASNNAYAYSEDGISWTELLSTCPLSSVAYGNGKFVAVAGVGRDKLIYSEDGISWWDFNFSPNIDVWEIMFSNGKFVVIGTATNEIAYSSDGFIWNKFVVAASGDWVRPVFGDGKFVMFCRRITNGSEFNEVILNSQYYLC